MKKRIASIDIGSTFTKAALFEVEPDSGIVVLGTASSPTTVENLAIGFGKVLSNLLDLPYQGDRNPLPAKSLFPQTGLRFSSSAKGGLRIAVIGLVPDLTLQIARLAAWSAGGRIVADSAYKLTRDKLKEMLSRNPDIILLTGGTDGGNETIVLENARRLADAGFSGTVLFAGNASIRSEVEGLFSGRDLRTAENLMPAVGKIQTEDAGKTIQRIFLDTIVSGRGLAEVAEFCGSPPKPTPLAVFDLVACIGETAPGWEDFCLIDLGGATTDFYSRGEAFRGDSGVVLRGIHEPVVKRTVEGDLGLRVSAESLLLSAGEHLRLEASRENVNLEGLGAYVLKIDANHGIVPSLSQETGYDALLALAACTIAAGRHAGRFEESYTPSGRVYLQTGKDLRGVSRLIGTGGYLSRNRFGSRLKKAFSRRAAEASGGGLCLLPAGFRYYRDTGYLFPLLGNMSEEFPQEAAAAAVSNLEEEE